ncbi:uncharacterized protein LOC143038043 isoform X3 [Oratosquilla oratoria]|uniref:uncharacterized protein LOC143038043 isoform X3 n=1 Tax=Oratosquilla oratoria TaxID=337810 RepID=UPI003F76ACA1
MALSLLNNAMTFTENQHGTVVLEKLRSQRDLVRCCDVILHVAGMQFHAHRCVLAACSPYFDSIFKVSKTVKEQLTISSQDPEVFKCLLAYMYTGTVVVDKTKVGELLRLANKFLIAKLKDHCAEYLERYLDASNCLLVRDMAVKFGLNSLERTTSTFISSNMDDIIRKQEVLELQHSRLEDFIKDPSWQLSNEQTLLLVTRWVQHNPATRERNLRTLLTWVQWHQVDMRTVIHLIQSHPLYSSSSSVLSFFFLLDALNENNLLPSELRQPFVALRSKFCQQNQESPFDCETFLSLAISTAIDEFQDEPEEGNTSPKQSAEMVSPSDDATCHMQTTTYHHTQGHSSSSSVKQEMEDYAVEESRDSFAVNPSSSCQHDHSSFSVNQNSNCQRGHESFSINQNSSCQREHDSFTLNQNSGCQHNIGDQEHTKDSFTSSETFSNQTMHVDDHLHFDTQRSNYSTENPPTTQNYLMTQNGPIETGSVVAMYNIDSDNCSSAATSRHQVSLHCQSHGHSNHTSIGAQYRDVHERIAYSMEESVSNESCPPQYTSQVYDQQQTEDSSDFNTREDDSDVYAVREAPYRPKQEYCGSYYVDSYSQNGSLTMAGSSDSQGAPSISHETESEVTMMNLIPPRSGDMKEAYHIHITSIAGQNFPKIYYQEESSEAQELCDFSQRMYFQTEDTSDTQNSIGPQDMTVQSSSLQISVPLCSDMTRSTTHLSVSHHISTSASSNEPQDQSCSPYDSQATEEDFLSEQQQATNEKTSKSPITLQCKLEEQDASSNRNVKQEKELQDSRNYSDITEHVVSSEGQSADDYYDIEHLCGATPRQVKFKINRSMSSLSTVSSLPNSTASNTSPSVSEPKGVSHEVEISSKMEIYKEEVNEEDEPKEIEDKKEKVEVTPLGRKGKKNGVGKRASVRIKQNVETGGQENKPSEKRSCDLCNASFDCKKEYFQHMKDHFPGPPHTCNVCQASFHRIYHLVDHRNTHVDAKPFKCPHCPYSSRKKFNLTEHLAIHSDKRDYKCKICGDTFTRPQTLKLHETKHTKERPYLCETCGWSGKTKNALITHKKIHTDDLFRCQYRKCAYTTPKKSHLKEHMQYHTKTRAFTCQTCNHSFFTKSHLRRHAQTHLLDKPFKCTQCDYCSARPDRLKMHIEKRHTQKPVAKPFQRKRLLKKNTSSSGKTCKGSKEHLQEEVKTSGITMTEFFSDFDSTNTSLQPQLPGTPPPTTLSEYPTSPHTSSYTLDPSTQSSTDHTFMIVQDMVTVTENLPSLEQHTTSSSPPLSALSQENSGSPSAFEDTETDGYQSPHFHTSPSRYTNLSPTHSALTFTNIQQQEESPLNFASIC